MDKAVKELVKVVGQNSNTKVEIKRIAETLKSLSSSIMRDEMQGLIGGKCPKIEAKQMASVASVSVATQTYEAEEEERIQNKEQRLIEDVMEAGKGLNDLERVLNLEWPEDAFGRTSFELVDTE